MLNTVSKIGPVLDLFTPEHPAWRMTDVARALDMPKTSAHSMVTSLAAVGLLSVGADGRYRLGLHLLTLAERMRESMDYGRFAVRAMQELQTATRETVLLAAMDRHEVVYVERVEGTHPMVRLAGVRVGTRAPVHCTAVGKAMLADRAPAEVRALARRAGLRAMTPQTITSIDALEEELIRVRAAGVAYDRQEAVGEIACVAAPIRDGYGTVVAALSISTPAYRFDRSERRLVDGVRQAADAISRRIATEQPCGVDASHGGSLPAAVA